MAVSWYRVDEEEPPTGHLLVWHSGNNRAQVMSKFPYEDIGNPELALTHWAIINRPKG